MATSTVVSKGIGMQASGTARPNGPGNRIMAVPTSNRMGGSIVGTARKRKTSAACDRPYTPNQTMIIGQTGVMRGTTSPRGEPFGMDTTSGTAGAGTDCSTSHEMKCTMEQRAFTLRRTGAPVSRRARDLHSREPEDRHSREGNQSKDSRDAHHTTDPHNTVQGSRPYSEIIQSRTVPVITSEGGDKARRSTAGNQAREGNDGKPDIVSVKENNGLSSPPASYASETQNHIDNTGDPSSDGEAGQGLCPAASPVPRTSMKKAQT